MNNLSKEAQKYKSLTLLAFQRRFPNKQACYEYLAKLKWPDGFKCERCGHGRYCKGKLAQTRQCTRCGHQATPTSGTLFHKVKFDILKAMYIVYFVSTNKQGISSTERSRKLGLRQKTCWSFRRKVLEAMASSKKHLMEGTVEVDETVIGQQEEGLRGRKNTHKKLVVVGIERKGRGISRMYAKVIKDGGNRSLRPFFDEQIGQTAHIKTDEWSGYRPLKKHYPNLGQVPSGAKGENFKEMHRVIMMLKAWPRGTHHAVKHLQSYLHEFSWRFNRAHKGEGIFENLARKRVEHKPVYCKQLLIY